MRRHCGCSQRPLCCFFFEGRPLEYATGQQLTRRQSTVWRALRAAAPQTIPVLAGYFVLGMGYGIYVQSLGLPVWMPMLMGTVVYGGTLCYVLLVQLVF